MTSTDGRPLGLAFFDPNILAHQFSPTTHQVRADLGLVGTLTRGPDGSMTVGSTVAGTGSRAMGTASFHINGINRTAASLTVPPPPPDLPVSMAKELLRLRTQVQELQAHQGGPPVSTSRERRWRRNAAHPTQTADIARASTFTRLGPLSRLDVSGRIHLESRCRTDPHDEAYGDGHASRTLLLETSAMASSAHSKSRGRTRTEVIPRIGNGGSGAGNFHHPTGSQGQQDD